MVSDLFTPCQELAKLPRLTVGLHPLSFNCPWSQGPRSLLPSESRSEGCELSGAPPPQFKSALRNSRSGWSRASYNPAGVVPVLHALSTSFLFKGHEWSNKWEPFFFLLPLVLLEKRRWYLGSAMNPPCPYLCLHVIFQFLMACEMLRMWSLCYYAWGPLSPTVLFRWVLDLGSMFVQKLCGQRYLCRSQFKTVF